MKYENGNFITNDVSANDPLCIKTIQELKQRVETYGFLPLFKNPIPGFSVEEMTIASDWWSGDAARDPWVFREQIATEQQIAYAKVFQKKAGFISKDWYPLFANYRRDGYDFDTRYECGLASPMDKSIYDLIEKNGRMSSFELKSHLCPKSRKGTGFDTSLTRLQMQTYLTVVGFVRKRDKKGQEYGWPAAVYERPEVIFGEDYVRSRYSQEPEECKQKLMKRLEELQPEIPQKQIERLIR